MAGLGSSGPVLPKGASSINSYVAPTLPKGASAIGPMAAPKPAAAPVAPVAPVQRATSVGPVTQVPMQAQAQSAAPKVDYSALLKSFAPTPAQAAPAQPMTNTSTPNPTITEINQIQLDRAKGDMNMANLGRASDIAIRDNAENERKASRERMAFQGTSGGGYADSKQSAITRDTLRAQTGARVDLANNAEARRDGLLGQVAGQAAQDEQLQDQQRNTALRQQQTNQQAVESARSNEIAQFRNVLDLFDSVESSSQDFFGGAGDVFGSIGGQMNSGRAGW